MEVKIEQLSKDQLEAMGVFQWPIWEKEPSEFDWYYDFTEQCYFLEGEVIVKAGDKEYHIKAGDFVTFPKGLSCTWKILKKVRKHYNFV
jgi:uncharacterized cupin superfamily protein